MFRLHLPKILPAAGWALWLLAALLLPAPAAALDMTLHNAIPTQEINWMGLKTSTGGTANWTPYTLPGGTARFSAGTEPRMASLKLDMGLVGYSFTDFAAVAEQNEVAFTLTREADGSPVLVLRQNEAVRIPGRVINMLPDTAAGPELGQVLAVKTMGEASALADNTALNRSGELLLTVGFADQRWRGTLVPDKPTALYAVWDPERDAPGTRPAVINLYGQHTAENLQRLLAALYAQTFRPWSGGVTQGPEKAILRSEVIAKLNLSPEQERELAAEFLAAAAVRETETMPVAEANLMLVPEALHAEALSDKQDLSPGTCVMLRVNSTECMELRWFYDCRAIISFSR